jgi:hypothetical protein
MMMLELKQRHSSAYSSLGKLVVAKSCTTLRVYDLTAKVEKAEKVLIPLACSPI